MTAARGSERPGRTADVVVIGAGTAGLSAFDALSASGRSVILVEGGELGTMCTRVGCMPSKAVLLAAHRFHVARAVAGPLGVDVSTRLWREALALRLPMVEHLASETIDKAGDRLVRGHARFVDARTIDVDGLRIDADAFVVAAGSRPVVPKAFAALGDRMMTTDDLFHAQSLPTRCGVVGLGPVGLEMSVALARFGIDVVAADSGTTLGGATDPFIVGCAVERFRRDFELWLGDEVGATLVDDGVRFGSGDRSRVVDRVLVAPGRQPNVEGLDLERAGVEFDDDGHLRWDRATTRCGKTRVFVAGDFSPDRPLLHEAVDEGALAAAAALASIDGRAVDPGHRRVPLAIVFSSPDIGVVGPRFIDLDPGETAIGYAGSAGNGRSRLMETDENCVRLYVDRATRRLVGATVFSVEGEHLAHLLAWAVAGDATVDALLERPFYHPTVEEMVQSALKDAVERLGATPRRRG